jgi:hypothetical protein
MYVLYLYNLCFLCYKFVFFFSYVRFVILYIYIYIYMFAGLNRLIFMLIELWIKKHMGVSCEH